MRIVVTGYLCCRTGRVRFGRDSQGLRCHRQVSSNAISAELPGNSTGSVKNRTVSRELAQRRSVRHGSCHDQRRGDCNLADVLKLLLPPVVDNTIQGMKFPVYLCMLSVVGTVRRCIHLSRRTGARAVLPEWIFPSPGRGALSSRSPCGKARS